MEYNINKNKIILASASPRRKELLEKAGVDFTVCVSDAEEIADECADAKTLVMTNAHLKAEAVAKKNIDIPTLGADTIVCLDSKIYGKPKDINEAIEMLTQLQGRTHSVYTGVSAIICKSDGSIYNIDDVGQSKVTFKSLSLDDIKDYITKVNVLDKAGAYAIQEYGSIIIESIDGDFDNVMGLPVQLSKKILDRIAQY